MTPLLALVGAVTIYAGPHISQPLYCADYYTTDHAWIALDVSLFWSGRVSCGDSIRVTFPDGSHRDLPALDAGMFAHHCVEQQDGSCLPIIGDLPAHVAPFPGTSSPATIENRQPWLDFAAERIPP